MEENTNTYSKPVPAMEWKTNIDPATSATQMAVASNSSSPLATSNNTRSNPHQPEGFGRALDDAIFTEPSLDDSVFAAVSEALRLHNIASFQHFRNPIEIIALAHEGLKYALSEEEPRYYVLRWGGLDQIVAFRVLESAGLKEVLIYTSHDWHEFETWLKALPRPIPPTSSASQLYEIQSRWWLENGKHFPLLSLPNELMDQVLLECLGAEVAVIRLMDGSANSYSGLFCNGARHETDERPPQCVDFLSPKSILPVNKKIFELSRELNHRAMRVFEQDTVKIFTDAYIFRYDSDEDVPSNRQVFGRSCGHPLKRIPPRVQPADMRRISLNLSMRGYIDLFGVPVPPLTMFRERNWDQEPDAKFFRSLPNLRELEMRFESPMNRDSSAWLGFAYEVSWELDELEQEDIIHPDVLEALRHLFGEIDYYRVPCQKQMTEMILLHAWRFIKDILIVELAGYIKTQTRIKRQEMLLRKKECGAEIEKQLSQFKKIPFPEL